MTKEVTIPQMLEKCYQPTQDEYIIVSTVWSSDQPTPKRPAYFIFADGNGQHIEGLLKSGGYKTDCTNLYKMLKNEGHGLKIKNLHIETKQKASGFLRHISKRLIIHASMLNVEVVAKPLDCPKFLPFDFTNLIDIEKCAENSRIDVIGYVTKVSDVLKTEKGKAQYQRVTLQSSTQDGDENSVERQITLFMPHINQITEYNAVYAILNLKVGKWGPTVNVQNMTLDTTYNSIFIKIDENTLNKLPSSSLGIPFVKNFLQFSKQTRSRVLKRLNGDILGNTGYTSNKQSKLEISYKTKIEDFPEVTYDFLHTAQLLKVEVQRGNHIFTGLENGPESYRMSSNPRGNVLIINNYAFEDNPEKPRAGSMYDEYYLSVLFQSLHFKVTNVRDLTSTKLQGELDKFKDSFTEEMDACVVIILSHGLHGMIQMVDGELVRLPNDLMHQFDELEFPVMAGKPKLFITQMCQSFPSADELPKIAKLDQNVRKELKLRNMIEVHATSAGTPACRDKLMGSHFIYAFVDAMMAHAHEAEFLVLLKLVQHRLSKIKLDNNQSLNCVWIPYHFKDLYFNP